MTSIIEFNDKDKLDIEFIGSLLRKNKFLVSKKISTEVSFTADKTIYLTQKGEELARITFYKSKNGFVKKFYDLELLFNHIGGLFKFYERKKNKELSKLNNKDYYDYDAAVFKDISFKTMNILAINIVEFIKNVLNKKSLNKTQSFKIWKETGISSEEFIYNYD
ncbi:hypothetical protein OAL61_05620 [Candidatus Pelagibacter sp.]|nr:hypothetical protein [Candidatus Pelagibacter sp.]